MMLCTSDAVDPVPAALTHSTLRLFTEAISAGFPSAAEGYEEERLNVHDYLVRNDAATFPIRVVGDALEASDHIVHGSILIVDRSRPAIVGSLVVIEREGQRQVLRLRAGERVLVWGVVVGVVRKF